MKRARQTNKSNAANLAIVAAALETSRSAYQDAHKELLEKATDLHVRNGSPLYSVIEMRNTGRRTVHQLVGRYFDKDEADRVVKDQIQSAVGNELRSFIVQETPPEDLDHDEMIAVLRLACPQMDSFFEKSKQDALDTLKSLE